MAVQHAAAQSPEAGCLLVAADALQQRVAELIEQVRCGQNTERSAALNGAAHASKRAHGHTTSLDVPSRDVLMADGQTWLPCRGSCRRRRYPMAQQQ